MPVTPTLSDLLAVPALQLKALHEGMALAGPVRWAQTTELIDPAPYLSGGELVCTVGATLSSPQQCREFVESLVRAGAVGLCFGLGDVHAEVPEALVAACRAHGLPILVAPLGAPFSAISEYLAAERVAAEVAVTRAAEALVSSLLAGMRSHEPMSALLALVVDRLGGQVELTIDGRCVARAANDQALPASAGAAVVAAVVDGGRLEWCGDGETPSPRLLAQIARVIEVALSERDVEAVLERERVGQLLQLVYTRLLDPAALSSGLAERGVGQEAIVVSVWPKGAAALLEAQLPGAFMGATPDVTYVLTESADRLAPTAAALTLPCGFGSVVSASQLGQGLSQARAAFELASAHGGVVGPEGLTSLEGLLEQQPPERLEPYVDQLIRPLVDSDHQRGTHYVDTLRAFLDNEGSLQRTARDAYLHVNTVRHRLGRIEHLTGRNPLVFTDRVALAIGLWALERRHLGD